jgi:acetyltransferase
MDVLREEVQARGIRQVISIESRANHAAIELERERGYVASSIQDDPTLVLLTKTFR